MQCWDFISFVIQKNEYFSHRHATSPQHRGPELFQNNLSKKDSRTRCSIFQMLWCLRASKQILAGRVCGYTQPRFIPVQVCAQSYPSFPCCCTLPAARCCALCFRIWIRMPNQNSESECRIGIRMQNQNSEFRITMQNQKSECRIRLKMQNQNAESEPFYSPSKKCMRNLFWCLR